MSSRAQEDVLHPKSRGCGGAVATGQFKDEAGRQDAATSPPGPGTLLSICLKTLQGRETSSDPSCCANHDQTVTCMALSWGPGPTEAHILPVLASMGQWDKSPPAPLCSVASRLSPQSFLHSVAACFSTKILGVTLLVSGHPGSLLLLLELPAAGGK